MGLTIEEDIGQMAGAIWYALNTHGEVSLAQLKKLVEGKGSIFDWAIGWLAREGKVVPNPQEALPQHPPEIIYSRAALISRNEPSHPVLPSWSPLSGC